jgi:hypothetical protein
MKISDFFQELNPNLTKWKKFDFYLFYVAIPLLLGLLFILPQDFKNSYLVLHPENVTYTALLLSNYTHTAFLEHFFPNILFYFLFIYLIFNLETSKKIFYVMMGLIFVPIAILASVVSINLPFILPNIQGFSVIVAGIMGYSIYATYGYLKNVEKVGMDKSIIFLVFLINAIFVVVNISKLEIALFLVMVALIVILFYTNRKGIVNLFSFLNKKSPKIKSYSRITFCYWWILFLIEILALTGLFFIIPSNPLVGSMITNSLAHYIGYCFGLLFPVFLEAVGFEPEVNN